MNILVTGSKGFIAKNLIIRLESLKNIRILKFNKKNNFEDLEKKIKISDIIFHLAGSNREKFEKIFIKNNIDLCAKISEIIIKNKLKKKIIFSSTTKIGEKNIYSLTKLQSEKQLKKCAKISNSSLIIYRIPNVFGKWSKPNYNSVFATFSHKISRNEKINLFNQNKKISFIYIDDLVNLFLKDCNLKKQLRLKKVSNTFSITPNDLISVLKYFKKNRNWFGLNLINQQILRKMYSTYLTYIPKKKATYKINKNEDDRGNFSEFLKMGDLGQFSYFTIKKNKTRGFHFHNTKIEKFLILKGKVKFELKNLSNNKINNFLLKENDNKVIETIPGCLHNLKNIGKETAIGIIWANEEFSKEFPDTYYIDEKI